MHLCETRSKCVILHCDFLRGWKIQKKDQEMEWIFTDVEHLVFSGGGVRGLAFVGAYQVLSEEFAKRNLKVYDRIKTFCGTSAGSMIALLASLGLSWQQMIHQCMRFDASTIIRSIDILSFSQDWGLHKKTEMVTFIRQVLQTFAGNADVTFQALHQMTGKKLIVSASRVNDSTAHFFSVDTKPTLEVWRAVCASMSIPVLFTPSYIGDDLYVDGGMLVNLPLEPVPLEKTLAFLLVRRLPYQVRQLRDYVMRVLYLALNGLEHAQLANLPDDLKSHIVQINTGNMSSVEFGISDDQKSHLIVLGMLSLKRILYPQLVYQNAQQMIMQSVLASLIAKSQAEIVQNEMTLPPPSPPVITNAGAGAGAGAHADDADQPNQNQPLLFAADDPILFADLKDHNHSSAKRENEQCDQ